MSGSKPRALGSTVVAADPSKPFTPGPVLAELLRTRHCVLGSVLLVEAIDAFVPISKTYRTVRLLLGDGDLCIQALLRMEMHRFVDHGSIYVGAYVQLHKFELRAVPTRPVDDGRQPPPPPRGGRAKVEARVDDDDEETAAAEEMVFLVVWDMVTVGWDTAYMQMAGVTVPPARHQRQQPDPNARRPEVETEEAGSNKLTDQKDQVAVTLVAPPNQRAAIQPAPNRILKQRSEPGLPEETKDTVHHTKELPLQQQQQQQQRQQQQQQTTAGPGISYSAGSLLPWASDDLTKPLKLTPLKSIPNLPYKQNWVVNVLAVVASLSDVGAATLPPFRQRTARLADPSTSKQVLLTVFLDPDGFAPRVGSVVLLLGVKNHRFDGGSLKKYGNEKRSLVPGARWWFEDPREIAWCDVEGLRTWWAGKSS